MVFYVPSFCVSFCTVSPSMCQDDIYVGLCNRVAIFWERAAPPVNRMSSL